MFRVIKLFLLSIVFIGCSSTSLKVDGSKKVFAEEDIYILNALRLEELNYHKSASEMFHELYKKSSKQEYLYRSLKNDLTANENERVIQRVDELLDDKEYDNKLIRFKVIALVKLQRLEEASTLALSLVKKSKTIDDYLLVSEIYVKRKQFDTALKYLESAYVKDYNEKLLDRMAIVLYVNLERKKDAIAQLETHSRVHGCSRLICERLIGFYSNDNNIDGLLSTYLRLYRVDSSKKVAKKIVQIYSYKKDYLKMIEFLEESCSDDELLFQLYIQFKSFKKASELADILYKRKGDSNYLGQSAIFEYESSKDKSDKSMHSSVIKKLENVIEMNRDTVYLNYLGYILIDHDIDVKKGMQYIKRALLVDPDSAYYLDSLAWGHYKLGECKKAKKVMDRVSSMSGGDNEEVVKHIKMINRCIKNKKGKR